jgi:DNA-binding Xre family transcriptional regulator
MKHIHLGSSFESFLEAEGMVAEVEAGAIKKLLALQIQHMMKEKRLSKSAMAQKMRTSRSVLDKLLDQDSDFVTLQTLEKAAAALGKRLKVELM